MSWQRSGLRISAVFLMDTNEAQQAGEIAAKGGLQMKEEILHSFGEDNRGVKGFSSENQSVWIGYAKEKWQEELCEIWKLCFGDEISYSRFFFSHIELQKQVMVLCVEGHPVSMLSVLWADTEIEGTRRELAYLYAVATHPKQQGRGYSGRLLEFAGQEMKAKNRIPILVPASKELADFYKKRGFTAATYLKKAVFEAKFAAEEAVIEKISAEEYYCMRNKAFAGDGYVKWSLEEICYRIEEAERFGGMIRKICWKGREYAAAGVIKQNRILELKETTIPDGEIKELAGELGARLGCQSVRACLPVYSRIAGEKTLFSMKSGELKMARGYLNLALD